MISSIKFSFSLLTPRHFDSMEAVLLKDMTTLDNEDKIEREHDKLAQNMIVCPRSLYVDSVKEILTFSQKHFDTLEFLTFWV